MARGYNAIRGKNASTAGGGGYNPMGAGRRSYGGGRPFPNSGIVGTLGKTGYTERDAKRRAILARQRRA